MAGKIPLSGGVNGEGFLRIMNYDVPPRTGTPALTLEIGSGHHPHWRSDILLDKFLQEPREREGDLTLDRPLLIADGENLPLRSKSMKYIVARHVLEHSTEPERFLREMERVGRGGYIETPNPIAEKLFNWPFHRWFVALEDGRLVLRRKEKDQVQFGNFFHLLASSHLSVRIFLRRHRDLFYTRMEWKDSIPFSLEDAGGRSEANFVEQMARLDRQEAQEFIPRFQEEVKRFKPIPFLLKGLKHSVDRVNAWRVKWRHRRYDFEEIFARILCCPFCKDSGDLSRGPDRYSCRHCGADFPLVRGVPVFNGTVRSG